MKRTLRLLSCAFQEIHIEIVKLVGFERRLDHQNSCAGSTEMYGQPRGTELQQNRKIGEKKDTDLFYHYK